MALPCRLMWRLYFSAFLCVCVYVCIYWMHAPYFIILITEWNTSSHASYGTVDGVCQYATTNSITVHLRKSKVRMLCICIAQEVSKLVPTLWWNPSPHLPSPHVFWILYQPQTPSQWCSSFRYCTLNTDNCALHHRNIPPPPPALSSLRHIHTHARTHTHGCYIFWG